MSISHENEIQELIETTMKEVFGCKPKLFQSQAISMLIKMSLGILKTEPIFLCQPTGGGKSFVRDTFAALVGGITINIAPLLSLNADQKNKLKSKSKCSNVHTLHLDEYKDPRQISEIVEAISKHPKHSPVSLTLFSSPQQLVDYPQYLDLIEKNFNNGTLKLIFVDEVQLITQFGLWFRVDFYRLKSKLFTKVKSKIPILFMTASANEKLLSHLELLTGIKIKSSNYIWPMLRACNAENNQFCSHPRLK